MDKVNFKYEIWQVREQYIERYGFMRYDLLTKIRSFSKDNYYKVYSGTYEIDSCKAEPVFVLDEIFEMFNVARPVDFKGHSLSVSDVVVLDGVAYYCDSFGWKEVSFK